MMEGDELQSYNQAMLGIAVVLVVVIGLCILAAILSGRVKSPPPAQPAEPPLSPEAREIRRLVNMIWWGAIGYLVVYFWYLMFP